MYLYLVAVTLLLTSTYASYRYFSEQLSYFERLRIPYVPGWPVFGNLANFCFGRQQLSETMREIYNVHPQAKYVGAFNFVKATIVLRDLDLIKTIATRHFDCFHDRPLTIDPNVDPLFGGNLFTLAGDRWRQMKSTLTPAFTSSKMKAMHELIVDCTRNLMNYLEEELHIDSNDVDTKDLFSRVTNDAIVSCAFGITTDSLRTPKNQIYVLGKEATRLEGTSLLKLVLFSMFPRLMKWLRVRLVNKKTADFFTTIVANNVRARDEMGIIGRPDMIQLMMNARGRIGEEELGATRMTAQAFIFYFGGFETVSTQMCLLAHELAVNPDVQRRLQLEIDTVMRETNGNLSYEDIQGMSYLNAVFDESLRLHAQFSFLERMCVKRFELPATLPDREAYVVEPGMPIWIPTSAINRDSRYYENPNKFMPERYYRVNRATMPPNLAFGIGPRGCIGNRFATLETKILFAYLLDKFNLLPTENTCSPLVYDKSSLTLKPVGGFFLRFEARNR